MRKHSVSLFFFLCLLLVAGFGCKGLTQEEQASVTPVTLEYWTVFNDLPELERVAKEYQGLRSHVTVNIRKVRPEEFDTLFTNALADDVAPDMVSVHTRELEKYALRLAPMPPRVTIARQETKGKYFKETVVTQESANMPSPRYIQEQYVKTVIDDVVVNGAIYGLPLAIDTLALYYNRDLLDKAGVATPPGSWEEFQDAVKKGTRRGTGDTIVQAGVPLGTGKNIGNAADMIALLLLQKNWPIMQGNKVTIANGLDKPGVLHPALEAMSFYTRFANPTLDTYTWNANLGDALTAFTQNKSVFYFGYAYDMPRIRALAPQMNLEVIPVPQLQKESPVNIANYWVESVVKKSKHQNEAWDFIRFMSTPEHIAAYTTATRRPTPLRSQITKQAEDTLMKPFAEHALVAENWYRGSNVSVAATAIANMADALLAPAPAQMNQIDYEAQLIINAAKVIQQTL